MVASVVNEPKTGTFQMRVNPEYKEELERVYADCGMTLTQAVNIFFQMSLKVGGLPFIVNRDPNIILNDDIVKYLLEQHRIGMESSNDGSWTSLEEAKMGSSRKHVSEDERLIASSTGRSGTSRASR